MRNEHEKLRFPTNITVTSSSARKCVPHVLSPLRQFSMTHSFFFLYPFYCFSLFSFPFAFYFIRNSNDIKRFPPQSERKHAVEQFRRVLINHHSYLFILAHFYERSPSVFFASDRVTCVCNICLRKAARFAAPLSSNRRNEITKHAAPMKTVSASIDTYFSCKLPNDASVNLPLAINLMPSSA